MKVRGKIAENKIESLWHESARIVAPQLLGRWLCRRGRGGVVTRWRITEVEAYCGPHDRASHAARGMTPRNRIMYGLPGYWYVYLCYGVHWMLNLVTSQEGNPSAVLLRGVEGASGPGRLTQALKITQALNTQSCSQTTGLWIEGPTAIPAGWRRRRGPRIGVDYAGPLWAAKHLRWWLEPVGVKSPR
ncbi:MAG TPA: DNA-3-methyladenine glycosylase [Opitutales bacterium]|jgi:DNA-3-methyladenine glycosylase|nr:DNA-3-methyladenine glycosylase [Opitutales bacterium]